MQPLIIIAQTMVESLKRDARVRVGVGAGASVLLSAGVLGMGGTWSPEFLQASARSIIPIERTKPHHMQTIDRSDSTVSSIIESLPEAERFELMLYNSSASDVLKRRGEYTVFVPSSSRFDYLPARHIASLSRSDLYDLALNHIVLRALPPEESLNGTIITAGETFISFEVGETVRSAVIGDANVLTVYKAKNGWVYLIDRVLTP